MKTSLAKLKKKAGFTLVEALIVLAILGVLAAVAIPAYNIQLENSRQKVDESTLATASSMAVSDYLLNNYNTAITYEVWSAKVGENVNLKIIIPGDANYPTTENGIKYTEATGVSTAHAGQHISITVTNGTLTAAAWA